jgi:hypothetical protein
LEIQHTKLFIKLKDHEDSNELDFHTITEIMESLSYYHQKGEYGIEEIG